MAVRKGAAKNRTASGTAPAPRVDGQGRGGGRRPGAQLRPIPTPPRRLTIEDQCIRGCRVGVLLGRDDGGAPLVDFPGNQGGPRPARSTVALSGVPREARAGGGPEVLLVFEAERMDRPIIVGVMQAMTDLEEPRPARLGAAQATEQAGHENSGTGDFGLTDRLAEARVDGRRVVIEADQEVVLRCGGASITLRRNGRVVIRGAYVETCAGGVNRIKGGTVQVN